MGPVLCTFCLQKFLRFHLKLGFVLHFVLLFDNLSYKCPTIRAIFFLPLLLLELKLSWTLKVDGRYVDVSCSPIYCHSETIYWHSKHLQHPLWFWIQIYLHITKNFKQVFTFIEIVWSLLERMQRSNFFAFSLKALSFSQCSSWLVNGICLFWQLNGIWGRVCENTPLKISGTTIGITIKFLINVGIFNEAQNKENHLTAPEINISPVPYSVSWSRHFVSVTRNSCRSSVYDIP